MKEKNEKLLTEEKMIKSFKTCKEIITIMEALFILIIIGGIVIFANICIENNFNMSKVKDVIIKELDYENESFNIAEENDLIEYSESRNNFLENVFIFGCIVKVISLMTIIILLNHILTDSINQKTPFVEKNINRIKVIAICSIFHSYGLIYFIVIIIVNQLFKYGYKLQTESDELL